jgi:hypothetical protein
MTMTCLSSTSTTGDPGAPHPQSYVNSETESLATKGDGPRKHGSRLVGRSPVRPLGADSNRHFAPR